MALEYRAKLLGMRRWTKWEPAIPEEKYPTLGVAIVIAKLLIGLSGPTTIITMESPLHGNVQYRQSKREEEHEPPPVPHP